MQTANALLEPQRGNGAQGERDPAGAWLGWIYDTGNPHLGCPLSPRRNEDDHVMRQGLLHMLSLSFARHILALANFSHVSGLPLSGYVHRQTVPCCQTVPLPVFFYTASFPARTTIYVSALSCFVVCLLGSLRGCLRAGTVSVSSTQRLARCPRSSQHLKNTCWKSE